MKPLIEVDFNNLNAPPIGKINISLGEAERLGLVQTNATLLVALADAEFQVDGILEFDEEYHAWFARPLWETRVDFPASQVVAAFVNASAAQRLNVLHATMDVELVSIQRKLAAVAAVNLNLVDLQQAVLEIDTQIEELRKAGYLLDPHPGSSYKAASGG